MGLLQEFKKFSIKGNAVDMAVGIIIGGAFGKVVSSLVNDLLMPPLAKLTGEVNFQNLFINLGSSDYATLNEAKQAGAITLNYGSFLQSLADFLIVAIAIFLLVKAMNTLRDILDEKEKVQQMVAPPEDIKLLREIRDALTKGAA